MSTLQEIARLVREELLTLIQPVQLLSVNPSKATGEVSGRFRSSSLLFDYSIKGGTVRYRPVGAGGRQDSVDVVEDAVGRLDAAARKPRNCVKGFSCGNTCIQQGRTCRAKGGAAAAKLQQAVKMLPAAGETSGKPMAQRGAAGKAKAKAQEPEAKGAEGKKPGKAPSLKEVQGAVLKAFGASSIAALKKDQEFQMAIASETENPLKTKEDWLKVYRSFVGVPANERDLKDGPTVINGIDVLKNFRPWHVFGLDPKKATNDDIRAAFRKTIMKHHPDRGGDPRVAERLKTMRDSLLALRPDKPKAGKGRRKDSADAVRLDSEVLLGSLLASRQRLLARRLATYRHRVGLGR